MNSNQLRTKLDPFYESIKAIILDKQHPITGLLPASTAVTVHGDYTDAWVRDNVYSILAVWGLALAYRKLDDDGGRGFELEQSCVKLMRGLLRSMMNQSKKVEAFKQNQFLHDALHAKYDTQTGEPVVGDHAWGHLQIDATSIFLLITVQMIASGLDIIWTHDEVNFIQNLVFYIERAYRTPDYGIWERGAKTNSGSAELNASSLGMAKAALEALNGFNLFGARGGQPSVVHIIPDNIAHAEITLSSMLPRESTTKEVDAALLSIISFPAFAIHNRELVNKTRSEIITKLQGNYGLKRFLRDGHQSVLEDEHRLHYEPEELKKFTDIESEWPLFYTYLYLDGLFTNNHAQIDEMEQRLEAVMVERGGQKLLPELYYVPEDAIEAEKAQPNSQKRLPNENMPLVWAQSLYFLGKMIREGVLHPGDIDPLGRRHLGVARRPVVQISFLAEDEALKQELAVHGVLAETVDTLEPIVVLPPHELVRVFGQVGRNDKLGLNGRSSRAHKSLSTSRLYKLQGKTIVFLASFFMQQAFYLAYDLNFLVQRFKSELSYIHRHWTDLGRPTVTIFLTRSLLNDDRAAFYELINHIRAGEVDGVPVHSDNLNQLLSTATFERIDDLHDLELDTRLGNLQMAQFELESDPNAHVPIDKEGALAIEFEQDTAVLIQRLYQTHNLYEQVELLAAIVAQKGVETQIPVNNEPYSAYQWLEGIYEQAGQLRLWAVVRRASGLLDQVDIDLLSSVSAILVQQKLILVGKSYSDDSLITRPLPSGELLEKIRTFSRDDVRDKVLTQEVLIYLGLLIKAKPHLFDELLTIRVGYLITLLTGQMAREQQITQAEAYENLMHMPPSQIQNRVHNAIAQYQSMDSVTLQLEALHMKNADSPLVWDFDLGIESMEIPEEGWHAWRQHQGTLYRMPTDFYGQLWAVFRHANGLIIGNRYELRNTLDSRIILSDMTPGEKAFAFRIEQLLSRVPAPEYRQLTIESLNVLTSFFRKNPMLRLDDHIVTDAVIGHAVRIGYLAIHPDRESAYDDYKSEAWANFYSLPPVETAAYLAQSLQFLLSVEPVG